jgi:hypothetical protein
MENTQNRVLLKHSTDPELEVHSVDIEERQSRPQRVENHVFNIKGDFEKKPKIADFISASVQPLTNNKRRPVNEYGWDDMISEDIKEESKSNKIEIGCNFTFSDDDESIFHDKEGIGFSIHDSIRAIRKEASKIDAVLAVDQVDRLQEEMKHLRNELQRQNTKTADLTVQVQMKDGQIGTLELERDLYKADTNKLANDLECCLMKLRRVGGTSSPIEIGYGRTGIVSTVTEIEHSYSNEVSPSPPQLITADHTSDTSDPVSQLDQSTSPLLTPRGTESPAGALITTFSTQARTSTSISLEVNEQPVPISEQPVSEKPQHIPKQRRPISQRRTSNCDSDIELATNNLKRHQKVPLFSLCRTLSKNKRSNGSRIRSVNPIQKTTTLDSKQKEKHSSKLRLAQQLNPHDSAHFPSGLLHEQVQVMSQRLHSSIKTSEDLRRRIATVHDYYEKQVHQLDERLMAACVQRSKVEFEKSRRNAPVNGVESEAHLESKTHGLDPRIQAARKSRVVTFNV